MDCSLSPAWSSRPVQASSKPAIKAGRSITGPGVSGVFQVKSTLQRGLVEPVPAEEADHDRSGERLGQQAGVAELFSVGHAAAGQPQSIRDAAEIDQHVQQLDQDPDPQPQIRARLTECLLQVAGRLPVAVIVQAHHGQQVQRFGPGGTRSEPGHRFLQQRAGARRIACVEVMLREPDPALGGVPAKLDRHFKQLGGGRGGAPRASPGSAFVQGCRGLGIEMDGGLSEVACPFLGIGGDPGEPAVHAPPVGGSRGRVHARGEQRMREPDTVAVDHDHAVFLGVPQESFSRHRIGAQGEPDKLRRGLGQRRGRKQRQLHIQVDARYPGPYELGQRVWQRPGQIPRATAADLPGKFECKERVAARHLMDPRQRRTGKRPPGPFMEHLVQGTEAQRPHPHPPDTARIGQP